MMIRRKSKIYQTRAEIIETELTLSLRFWHPKYQNVTKMIIRAEKLRAKWEKQGIREQENQAQKVTFEGYWHLFWRCDTGPTRPLPQVLALLCTATQSPVCLPADTQDQKAVMF